MKNIQIQEQRQQQQQLQRISQQQMLMVRLLGMPVTELEQCVSAELFDNPALEPGHEEDLANEKDHEMDDGMLDIEEDMLDTTASDTAASDIDEALSSLHNDDDELPVSYTANQKDNADYEEMVYGDTVSFYDKLREQLAELYLTEEDRQVMEYLMCSLDDDGLLRKPLDLICDELAVYNNMDLSEEHLADLLQQLQTLDPPGIGAQSLQECLRLQILRKPKSVMQQRMLTVINDHFEAFTKKHWKRIAQQMELSETQTEALADELRKLNPKPGAAMGEALGRNMQQITPDFIIEKLDDGQVVFSLNQGQVPELHVADSFREMVDTYRAHRDTMSRKEKEALLYAKEKVDKAIGFIEAIRQRRKTLIATMKAIIDWQRNYFREGDEADLQPMILKDIAEKTGLDISTISRVSNEKYAQTPWGTFPLRFFFSDSITTDNGEELSTRRIKLALRELIDKEDKQHPLPDDLLAQRMKEAGFPIARRTVAKYREQLGIPVARLRK